MIPKHIKEQLTAKIPQELILQRQGGGKQMLSYISGATVTTMLNRAFDWDWDWETQEFWVQNSVEKFNQYAKTKDATYNGKEGAWEYQLPVCHCKGILTVRYIDENGNQKTIRKSGVGSKSINGGQTDQEHIYKAASTDALKKAASLLGIGLDLYYKEEEQAYFDYMEHQSLWSDEEKENHKDALNFVDNLLRENGLEEESLAPYVSEWSGNKIMQYYKIGPSEIESFVEYLKKEIEE